MFMNRGLIICLAASAAAIGLAGSAIAAPITWGTPTGISADTDVVTTGTLVNAINGGDGTVSPTVNGVTFTGLAGTAEVHGSVSSGNITISTSSDWPPIRGDVATFGSASGGFANLSPSYQSLLKSGLWQDATPYDTITLSNLTVGTQYIFQFWANDSRPSGRNVTLTDPNSNAVILHEDQGTTSNAGQFVTGTFTADATSEAITLTGSSSSILANAMQLRAVPEPASLSLLGVAGLMLLNRRK
jgi:hypothetical protein